MTRKIIAVCAIPCGDNEELHNTATTIALCDDGTLWGFSESQEWEQYPPIPQPESCQHEFVPFESIVGKCKNCGMYGE